MIIENEARGTRYRDLLPEETLKSLSVAIVGVGAIGRQAALQLAAMGVGRLTLIDPDVVEPVNLGPQAYLEEDVGKPKAEATAELCRRLNSVVDLDPQVRRATRSTAPAEPVVLACVDRIETRRVLWEAVKDRVDLFVDGRMAAEVVRVLAAPARDAAAMTHYPTTLFSAGEAYAGPCTARSTVYGANLAAALMVGGLSRWIRGLPVEADVTVNMMAGEWSCAGV